MPERTIDPAQLASYTAHLRREERSPGTIEKYLRDIRAFAGWLDDRPVSRELVAEWRDHLLSKDYAPVTINSMLAALNGLFHFLGWDECRAKFLKVQRRLFRDADSHPFAGEHGAALQASEAAADDDYVELPLHVTPPFRCPFPAGSVCIPYSTCACPCARRVSPCPVRGRSGPARASR